MIFSTRMIWTLTLLMLCAGPVLGQAEEKDDKEPALPFDLRVEAVRAFSSVPIDVKNWAKYGVVQRAAPEGKMFVVVFATASPDWAKDEKVTRLKFDRDQFHMTDSEGTKYKAAGKMQAGMINPHAWSEYVRRPRDWNDGGAAQRFNRMFLVPADAKALTFHVAGESAAAPAPAPVPLQPPADQAMVSIDKVEKIEAIDVEEDFADEEISTRLTAGQNVILRVHLKIKPLVPNDDDGKYFQWQTGYVAGQLDGKYPAIPLGEDFMNGVGQNVSHSVPLNTTKGEFSAQTETFYFIAPPDAKTIQILWLGQPVGDPAKIK